MKRPERQSLGDAVTPSTQVRGRLPRTVPNARPVMALNRRGDTPATAIICGQVGDDMPPLLVTTTGMVYGIRKGETVWVVGTLVAPAVRVGGFVIVGEADPEPDPRPTRLPDGTPGWSPEAPGRADQWHVAFTECVRCKTRSAAPGQEWCDDCLAEAAGETPLQRALRLAGT